MANEIDCGTCDGSGLLIGDKPDARGERTDHVERCPECNPEPDFEDVDDDAVWADRFDRAEHYDAFEDRAHQHAARAYA